MRIVREPVGPAFRNGKLPRRLRAHKENMPVGRMMVHCVSLFAFLAIPGLTAPRLTPPRYGPCTGTTGSLPLPQLSTVVSSLQPIHVSADTAVCKHACAPATRCMLPALSGSMPVHSRASSDLLLLPSWIESNSSRALWQTVVVDAPGPQWDVLRQKAKGSVATARATRGIYAEDTDDSIHFTSSEDDGPTARTSTVMHTGPPAGPPSAAYPGGGNRHDGDRVNGDRADGDATSSGPQYASCSFLGSHHAGDRHSLGNRPRGYDEHSGPCPGQLLEASCVDLSAAFPRVPP